MLDDADRIQIISLFHAGGKSKAEIAANIGCSPSAVYGVLAKAGLHMKISKGSHGHSIRAAAARAGLGG